MDRIALIALTIAGYVVGGIPTGYWFSQLAFGKDILHHGSGNIGASNVARVHGKKFFLLIFALDALKAFLFLHFFQWCGATTAPALMIVVAVLLLGNAYSPFLWFKGGKGVSTVVGILVALYPWPLAICFAVVWIIVLVLFERPYLASLAACSSAPLVVVMIPTLASPTLQRVAGPSDLTFLTILACWIVVRHIENVLGS